MATGGFQSSWGFVPVTHDTSKTTGQHPFMQPMKFPAKNTTGVRDAASSYTGAAKAGQPGYMFPDMYINSPGYDNSAAIRALYDSLRSKGSDIYGKTKGTLKDIYGDLRAAYEPLQENTRVRYDTAVSSTAQAKQAGDTQAALRASAEDAARRDMMLRMGVASEADTGSGGGNVDLAREEGATNREALQSNWAGLMGAMSSAQQGRDASSLRGATDQETMALEELATRWSDYQNELAQRQAQAMQGARGGGGQMLNPLYAQMGSSNPMIAMLAQQQFSNQSGMPMEQIYSMFNPQQQSAVDPRVQEFFFNSNADYAAGGKGGVNEFQQMQARNSGLTWQDYLAYKNAQ